jgi:hypothetical protein
MRKSRRGKITEYLAMAWIVIVCTGITFLFGTLLIARASVGQF